MIDKRYVHITNEIYVRIEFDRTTKVIRYYLCHERYKRKKHLMLEYMRYIDQPLKLDAFHNKEARLCAEYFLERRIDENFNDETLEFREAKIRKMANKTPIREMTTEELEQYKWDIAMAIQWNSEELDFMLWMQDHMHQNRG